MNEILLKECFDIAAGDFASAGSASAKIKKVLKQLGIDSEKIRRSSIIAYEAELNLVIHSLGGQLCMEVTPQSIIITTADRGPGIADVALALKEGWSTATDDIRNMGFGAGMGLPNMKKNSDAFAIDSKINEGTNIKIMINL